MSDNFLDTLNREVSSAIVNILIKELIENKRKIEKKTILPKINKKSSVRSLKRYAKRLERSGIRNLGFYNYYNSNAGYTDPVGLAAIDELHRRGIDCDYYLYRPRNFKVRCKKGK